MGSSAVCTGRISALSLVHTAKIPLQQVARPLRKRLVGQPYLRHSPSAETEYSWATLAACHSLTLSYSMVSPQRCHQPFNEKIEILRTRCNLSCILWLIFQKVNFSCAWASHNKGTQRMCRKSFMLSAHRLFDMLCLGSRFARFTHRERACEICWRGWLVKPVWTSGCREKCLLFLEIWPHSPAS